MPTTIGGMEGRIVKVSGPTVVARGLDGAGLYEVVRVGREGMLGEVVRIRGEMATVQVYEETTGLGLGEPVIASGHPMTVELGPGLLGQIFDGIQRPLPALAALSGDFLRRGLTHPALDREKRWGYTPTVKVGEILTAAVRELIELGRQRVVTEGL